MSRPIYYTQLEDAMKDADEMAHGSRGRKIVWLTDCGRYYVTAKIGEIKYIPGGEDWMAVCWYENANTTFGPSTRARIVYHLCI